MTSASSPEQLRDATRSLHQQVETLPVMTPLADGTATLDQYRRAMALLYGFYRPWEDMLFAEETASTLGVRPKRPALEKDLAGLGLSASEIQHLPRCPAPPALTGGGAIGALYVLEGATLGGQVVRRRLAGALGARAESVTSFHGFHGDSAGPWWKRFQAGMAEVLDRDPAVLTAACDAAVLTFTALLDWLGQDRSSRAA